VELSFNNLKSRIVVNRFTYHLVRCGGERIDGLCDVAGRIIKTVSSEYNVGGLREIVREVESINDERVTWGNRHLVARQLYQDERISLDELKSVLINLSSATSTILCGLSGALFLTKVVGEYSLVPSLMPSLISSDMIDSLEGIINNPLLTLVGVLLSPVVNLQLFRILHLFYPFDQTGINDYDQLYSGSILKRTKNYLNMTAIKPIGEEFVFRFGVQGLLQGIISPLKAIMLQTTLFSLSHPKKDEMDYLWIAFVGSYIQF